MIVNIDGRFTNLAKVIEMSAHKYKKKDLLKIDGYSFDEEKPFHIYIGLIFEYGEGMAGRTGLIGYKTKEDCEKRIEEIVEKYNK